MWCCRYNYILYQLLPSLYNIKLKYWCFVIHHRNRYYLLHHLHLTLPTVWRRRDVRRDGELEGRINSEVNREWVLKLKRVSVKKRREMFLWSDLFLHIKLIEITFSSMVFKALCSSYSTVHLKQLIKEYMWGLNLRWDKQLNIYLRKLKTMIIDILIDKYLWRLVTDQLLGPKSLRIFFIFHPLFSGVHIPRILVMLSIYTQKLLSMEDNIMMWYQTC